MVYWFPDLFVWMALPSPHCRTSDLTIAIPHCTTKDFYHVGFFLLTSQWRGCEIRLHRLWASPRHCQQMCWGCTLITHEDGAYAQTPEVFKGDLHPHGTLWLRRRCATSPTLSREVFSEPLTSWSSGRMGRKGDFHSAAALWPSALLFTPTCPWRQEQGRSTCLSLGAAFSCGWLVPVPGMGHGAQHCLLPCHLTQPPFCLSQPSLEVWYALPETEQKVLPSHPQDLPPKSSAHTAWKSAELTNMCHGCLLLLALAFPTSVFTSLPWKQAPWSTYSLPSLFEMCCSLAHYVASWTAYASRLKESMDLLSYFSMFIFILFVFIYYSFPLKFYSCQLGPRLRARKHPRGASSLTFSNMSPALHVRNFLNKVSSST